MQLGSQLVDKDFSICSSVNIDDCLLKNMDVGIRTTICIADLEFREGVKYETRIRSTNIVASELSSDGFVVDSTPPVMGEVTHVENPPLEESSQFTSSGISVEWNGFFDKESGVRHATW